MFNKTKLDSEESFFIYVKDSNTNRVSRIAFPSDVQIGTNGNPKELHLLGALSLSTSEYISTSKVNSLKLSDHDTVVNIKSVGTPSNNEIIVLLPPAPRDGQLHCIKDAEGISSTYEIKIRSSVSNTLIDNSTELALTNDFDSAILYWRDAQWHVLMKTSTGGSGTGAPTNATYLTLSSNATLTNERTLSLSGSNISLTDNGPNSTAQLNLTSILGTGAGTFANATVTADAFGRITAISSGSSGGAPIDAQYVVITNNPTLTQERALAVGLGLILADAGANNNVTLSVNNGVVATLTGSTFSGPVVAGGGLTGSLQRTPAGLSYLVAGSNIIVTSQSNGQVIISSTATGSFSGGAGADVSASYIVVGNTASLPNERALTAGYGLALLDGGANGNLIISFQGSLSASGGGSGADVSASYITIGNTASLPNERALVAGYGMSLVDGGPGNSIIVSFNGSLSGSSPTSSVFAAYSGYTTGAINLNETGSWIPILSGTQGHFQDIIASSITRTDSIFTIEHSGSYRLHASFNIYASDAYITLRLSGSSGTALQRSTYRSTPIDQNPATLDGIFNALPMSIWSLEYVSSGTVYPWVSSNPLHDGSNMWTGEISIYKI